MSKKENKQPDEIQEEVELEQAVEETPTQQAEEAPTESAPSEADGLRAQLADAEDKYLRLRAEYDNFRRRSQKEKEGIYADAKADAV